MTKTICQNVNQPVNQAANQHKPIMSKAAFNVISLVQFILTLLLIIGIYYYNCGTATVPTGSMHPTLQVGSMFIFSVTPAEEMTYDDIVTFFPEGDEHVQINNGFDVLRYQRMEGETVYVKRIIGMPGDVLEIKEGYVWRNGEKLEPDYVHELMIDTMEPYTVPEGHFFCMGDNRNNSLDSRYFGAFPMNVFFGKEVLSVNRPSF